MMTRLILLAVPAVGAAAPVLLAQPTATPAPVSPAQPERATPPPAAPTPPPPPPPQVRLGQRVEAIRRNVGVVPTLVIVPDTASYVAAVAAWRMTTPPAPPEPPASPGGAASDPSPPPRVVGTCFPVLIDDGSFQSGQDIARFARAFQPAKILRWKQEGPATPPTAPTPPVPADIEAALALAWGATPPIPLPDAPSTDTPAPSPSASLAARWKSVNFTPPGVVVASPSDPAWPAALALAAGHGQALVWLTPPGGNGARSVDERYSLELCDALSTLIEAACVKSGYAWNTIGDDLDCVTLALNTPAAVQLGRGDKRDMLATTDLVGRSRLEPRTRWAWCGQVFGNEARSTYAAMCSLFLQPRAAWLFDGYENTGPFAAFDAGAASDVLRRAGYTCTLDDSPAQSDHDWRRRIAGAPEALRDTPDTAPAGIDAGFIAVNTSGYSDFFDLKPGQCKVTDVPLLRVPPIVHFVHSWSAHQVGTRTTIAGRFIANGAYIYVGSVHEPYLSAFVPTPLLMQRLLALAPLGVSARLDDAEPWKVAIVGDPLFVLGPPAPRVDAAISLPHAVDLHRELEQAVEAKDSDAAIRLLALLGRDADAAALVRARLAESPVTLTPDTALLGALCMFRSAWPLRGGDQADPPRHVLIAHLVRIAGDRVSDAPEVRDALWHAAYPYLGSLTDDVIEVLKAHPRPEQLPRDAIDLAGVIRRVSGAAAANNYLGQVRAAITHEPWKKELDRAMAR